MPKPSQPLNTQVKPDPTLEKRSRRTFTGEYKLKIVRLVDECEHGEIGPLLRREKLYANQISQWRKELADHGVEGLEKSAPGPRSALTAEQKRIAQLEREVARLRRQMSIKDDCLELQKKALHMVEQLSNESSS